MNYPKPIRILGSGKYLPKKISSDALEGINTKLPRGFGQEKNGVKFRHQVTFESIGYMGARAAEEAVSNAGLTFAQIDLLISAGATFDYPLPSQSSVIKSELKECYGFNFPAFDINSTCLSFVSAFEVASKMLDGMQYKKILIVSSEIASKGLDTNNPETYTLFGDGAVAFVLSYEEQTSSQFLKACFKTYAEGLMHTIIRGGGALHTVKDTPYEESFFSFQMDGIKMLKLAKKTMPDFLQSFLADLAMQLTDFDAIIPHQASKTGIQLFKNLFNLEGNQVKENIVNYGNCIAASIPLLLHDCIEKGEIRRGNMCLLIGTSAGFSIGGLAFRY